MMKFILAALLLPATTAFMTPMSTPVVTALQASDLNGWVPDESKFAYGLPGSLDPVGECY